MALLSETDESKYRMEQILKLDANALLSTIRELEQKLSNFQRYDKPPPWFASLEQRISQIESWQQSFPANGAPSPVRESFSVRETDGLSANEISFDQQNFYNEQFVSGIEQKIMSKLKTDLAVKVENISLQFADQLLNNSLEMDRLHKLLIIRPTTSELQQVVLNLQTMEENSTKQIQSVYHTLQSRIKDSISTEMVQLLNELKTHQQHSNEKMEVISKLISNYSRELEEIQRNEQRSMQMLESTIANNKNDLLRGTEELRSIISQQIEEKFSFNQTSQDRLVAELRQLHDEIRDERERSQLQLSQLDGKVATEQAKLKNEIRDINDSIHTTATSLASLDNEVHLVKNGLKMEAAENKSFRGETDDALIQQKLSIRDLQNTLKEFQAFDLFTRVPKLEDHTLRLAAEISQVASALTALTNTEVRSLLERSQQLEEQVQVVLPKLIQSESIRITSLIKDFEVMASNQTIFNNRMADAEELLNNLLPLQNKFKLLNEKCEKLESDVQSCRSLVESSIDANSEIIRRIEDMEEKFESLDELISSRMNSIRDTLMETLLEKQYETASMMKNVKDNLEMISMAGENVPAAPTAPPQTAKLSRMASNVGKNFVSDGNDGPAPAASRGVSAVMAMPKRQASYRRPTISGAMVTGNSMGPENNNNNNNMGSHFHHQPPSNTPSIMMSDSFSTGQNTPRTHSNDDAISASSFAGKPAPLKKDLGRAINAIGNNNNSRPARLSRVVSGRSEDSSISSPRRDDEQLQPEQDDNEHVSGFDDDVFNHFMDNYNPAATSASVVEGGGSLLENSEFGPAGLQQPSVTSAASQQKNAVGKASVAPKKQKKPTSATAASSGSHHPLGSSRASSPPSSQLAALPLQQSAVPTSLQTRSDVLAVDFSRLVHESQGEGFAYLAESQFLADLCINYEEISTKKKRISNVPPVLCRSLLEVAQRMAESIANSSDFEMVEMVLARIIDENVHHLADIQYDETFVITRRQQKLGQCLEAIQRIIGSYYQASHVSATGAVRNDARHVFLTMVRKALELFLTKHNQILVVGNSRLGRTKIPSCIACDRPLIEKTRLEGSQSPTHSRAASPGNQAAWALDGEFADLDGPAAAMNASGSMFPAVFQENSVVTTQTTTTQTHTTSVRLHSAHGLRHPASSASGPIFPRTKAAASHDSRPRTSAGNREAEQPAYVMKAGFKMPQRPNSSHGSLHLSASTPSLPNMF